MIVILSDENDLHALAVMERAKSRGIECVIIDTARLSSRYGVSCHIDDHITSFSLTRENAPPVAIGDATGVWWRRPTPAKLGAQFRHPATHELASREWDQAWVGALAASDVVVLNPIQTRRWSRLKLVQLRLASECGLKVPRTLISTCPDEIGQFCRDRPAVYKLFTGTDFGFFETRRLDSPEDLSDLHLVSGCPLQVQEEVYGDFDVRATVVGTEVFAAEIHYHEGRHGVDCRVEDLPTTPHELPDEIRHRLLQLMNCCGLLYGAVDLRYCARRGYTFFEVNPDGQYLWTEIAAGLEISDAIARLLAGQMQFSCMSPLICSSS